MLFRSYLPNGHAFAAPPPLALAFPFEFPFPLALVCEDPGVDSRSWLRARRAAGDGRGVDIGVGDGVGLDGGWRNGGWVIDARVGDVGER